MEEFLPFLIGIGYFVYKTYENYKQEQEKARKRNPSRPVIDVDPEELFVPEKLEKRPIDLPAKQQPADVKGDYERKRVEEKYREVTRPEVAKEPAYQTFKEVKSDLYNPEQVSEETLRSRSIHKKHNHGKVALALPPESPAETFEFDMQQAIIYDAILNRAEH
ncbi:hypothetical protein [Pedobacter sp. SYSU D00535]|uniref:hypothetical protein n=1 Tax=Pedobacter sp. SYSU D00535 TaxID=2810308 RepID=UPI001A966037|nr:hypothetical protein [Pedobacter sp. SYSU D00535]